MDKLKPQRFPTINDKLTLHHIPTGSVGVPAIWSSLRHMRRYMDLPEALKSSLKMNQKGGFDCAGCAWPDPDDERSSLGEYCENGIKALTEEASKKLATPDFWAKHSISELANMTEFELGKSGRITEPMFLPKGAKYYEPISWDKAFDVIGKHLNSLSHPDEAVFYTSGRTSNEAAFLFGTFARAYGTNNLPDCSNMCHEASGAGLSETLGLGKGSVRLDDLYIADLIMVIGQNPGTNHPRMLNALERCKQNGGKIISVNPLKEAGLVKYTNPQKPLRILAGGVDLSDLYLQVKINGDIALLKAIMYKLWLIEDSVGGVFDHDFIQTHTAGYDMFLSALKETNIEQCIADSGISEKEIDSALNMLVEGNNVIICWAMGITQHANGVENVREIVNLLLLKGSLGKPGAGVCPVRGHSNVQGDRTMGIWEKMSEEWLDNLGKAFNFKSPIKHGYDTVGAIDAMYQGKAKVFIGMGGNFVSATPDTDLTAAGLQQCKLTVHVSTKPNRSHITHGEEALILPVLGRSEIDTQRSGYQFVSTESSMGVVQSSKGVLAPKSSKLKSEVAVITGIAKATLVRPDQVQIDWDSMEDDYDLIRDKIEAVIPGFEDYNERVRLDGGFYLPHPVKQRIWKTNTGKANFSVNPLPIVALEENLFRLTTVRSHDQYNTTLYGLDDRYRGVKNGRDIVFMNKHDMDRMGISSRDFVHIHSDYDDGRRSVYNFRVVPYDIPQQCLAAYFPEANPLIALQHHNLDCGTPISKNVVVSVEKLA